ncbi:MAG: 50S ribosomal protein L23 [Brevinematia bacterium]
MPRSVILAPILNSEKVRNMMTDKDNKPTGLFVFKVRKNATKMEIKQEIEKLYNVEVASVNTCIQPKKRRFVARREGFTSSWKKAYIKLAKGTIPILEEVSTKTGKEEEKKEEKKTGKKMELKK